MSSAARGDGIFDQYTTIQWIAAGIVALLTFPIGLAVPAYFYIKTSNGSARDQGAWEAWAVILVGILGIVAVELGGETGAKIAIAVALLGIPVLLILFAAVIGSFVVGMGNATAVALLVGVAV
ncbi:hypothetical protein [Haloarcula sp. Atlit-7R]|uniref:hypothetical protein n=1 Tax=Haloarcula TaxID=2237 RepID=UPI000EF1466F|nr:hypothetical protein [Haloarcula sp. Atlit-7R]RLM95541.1 hypothetical protein D3D01_12580 [Haloarcula sp. Atlit-7R]